jgi:hypothetical protein
VPFATPGSFRYKQTSILSAKPHFFAPDAHCLYILQLPRMVLYTSLNTVRRFLFAVQTYPAANLIGDDVALTLSLLRRYTIVRRFNRETLRIVKFCELFCDF